MHRRIVPLVVAAFLFPVAACTPDATDPVPTPSPSSAAPSTATPTPSPAPTQDGEATGSNWVGRLALSSGSVPAPHCWTKTAVMKIDTAQLTETSCDPTTRPVDRTVTITPELRQRLDTQINQLRPPTASGPVAAGAKTILVDLSARKATRQFGVGDNQPEFKDAQEVYDMLAKA